MCISTCARTVTWASREDPIRRRCSLKESSIVSPQASSGNAGGEIPILLLERLEEGMHRPLVNALKMPVASQ